MPIGSRLNLEVGCKTWRFNPEDQINGGPPKRGGQFESPTRARSQRQSINVDRQDPGQVEASKSSAGATTAPTVTTKKKISESDELDLEKKALEAEKRRISEMAERAAAEQDRIAELGRQASIEKARIEELRLRAAEQENLRLENQERIDEEKQRMLFEADLRLQRLREQVAEVEEKHRAELAYWEERERRTVLLEAEAEARAKAREEAEEARSLERSRTLDQERTASLERARQEAIEEYRRAHEELRRSQEEQLRKEVEEVRRAQEEQLRKEVEEAKRKIAEESQREKLALEKERLAKVAQMKEEMQVEIKKCMDEGAQWYRTSGEEFKEVAATVTRNFKIQELQALRNLYSAAGDRYLSNTTVSTSNSTLTHSAPSTTHMIPVDGPIPSDLSPASKEKWKSYRHEARRRGLLENYGLYPSTTLGQGMGRGGGDEWNMPGAIPGRVIGLSSASSWGTPSVRHRTNSAGQNTLRTPFIAGSSLMHQESLPRIGAPGMLPKTRGGGSGGSRLSGIGENGNGTGNGVLSGRSMHYNYPPGASLGPGWGAPGSKPTPQPQPMRVGGGGTNVRGQYGQLQPDMGNAGGHGNYGALSDQDEENGQFCVVTVQSIPGFSYERIFGEVYGSTLRDIPDIPPAQHLSIQAQELVRESAMFDRMTAVEDLIRRAKSMGANGVIGLSFHTNPITQTSCEVVATATAVKLVASDKMAVMPSDVEHATRTAHQIECQGNPTGLNGRTNENDNRQQQQQQQKKKNKGNKGNQGGEDEELAQNGDGKNKKKANKQQQQQQTQSKNKGNGSANGWRDEQTTAGSNARWPGDTEEEEEEEEDSSLEAPWNQRPSYQASWDQSQNNQGARNQSQNNQGARDLPQNNQGSFNQSPNDQGGRNQPQNNQRSREQSQNNQRSRYQSQNNQGNWGPPPADDGGQGGRKGGEKSCLKKEKKASAQQQQQQQNQAAYDSGGANWDVGGYGQNGYNQAWNLNGCNNGQDDEDVNQRSNNNKRQQQQQNAGRDYDQNGSAGGGQRAPNFSGGNDGQRQRAGKANHNSNLNGNYNQWNANGNPNGNWQKPQDDRSNDYCPDNKRNNVQNDWQNNDEDGDWSGKRKDKLNESNQEVKKGGGGKGGKGPPLSQAEIQSRKEEAQRNKADKNNGNNSNKNNNNNSQKQSKKGKQPPPPPDDDDDEDSDDETGMMGGFDLFS